MTNYDEATRHVLSAALLVAPTDVEQATFVRMHTELMSVGVPPKTRFTSLLDALLIGVRYDNWPRDA